MATPYLGEIRIVAFTFPPVGWLDCNGALVSISDFPGLFDLIGTTYGGDGQTNFQVPNLQSRLPLHQGALPGGQTYPLAATGGAESVVVTGLQVPVHSHQLMATASGQQNAVSANVIPATVQGPPSTEVYGARTTPTTLHPASVQPAGGNGQHGNIQPYLALRFVIATEGVYPSPT